MEPLLLVVGAVVVALGVARLLAGRRFDKNGLAAGALGRSRGGYRVPAEVDRHDFDRPEAPWLVAVFTSAACDTCAAVAEAARLLECDEVAVCELEARRDPVIHDRYRIDAVPILIAADASGLVRRSFVGPLTAAELWGAMAELRDA